MFLDQDDKTKSVLSLLHILRVRVYFTLSQFVCVPSERHGNQCNGHFTSPGYKLVVIQRDPSMGKGQSLTMLETLNSHLCQRRFTAVYILCFDAFLFFLSITGMPMTWMQREYNPWLGLTCPFSVLPLTEPAPLEANRRMQRWDKLPPDKFDGSEIWWLHWCRDHYIC